MSFKDTAKAAIIAEIINTPEMAIVNDFKAFVMAKIAEPVIDLCFIYVYPTPLKQDQLAVMNLCAQIGLDNMPVSISMFAMTVQTEDILK